LKNWEKEKRLGIIGEVGKLIRSISKKYEESV